MNIPRNRVYQNLVSLILAYKNNCYPTTIDYHSVRQLSMAWKCEHRIKKKIKHKHHLLGI